MDVAAGDQGFVAGAEAVIQGGISAAVTKMQGER